MESENEYVAFISYRHTDKDWAKWVQEKLEYFKLPSWAYEERSDLPDHLRPVFRDETDLRLGYLKENIEKALDVSRFLIVICSPEAPKSTYVEDEIAYFISIGKKDRIIPFIVSGEPYSDGAMECLPKPIRAMEPRPLAANVAEMGQDYAMVKVVCQILDLDILKLWPRYRMAEDEENRRKQREREYLLTVQSRYLSECSFSCLQEGDAITARLLALEALPKDVDYPERPYRVEAEKALRAASRSRDTFFLDHKSGVTALACSPDGRWVASGDREGTVKLWDFKRQAFVCDLSKHTDAVKDLVFSSDGNRLVSTGDDNEVYVWDAERRSLLVALGTRRHPAWQLLFSPDGKTLYVEDSSRITMYDTAGWKPAGELLPPAFVSCASLDVSPDGRYVAAINFTSADVNVWDTSTNKLVQTFCDNAAKPESAYFTPDGQALVSVVNAETGMLKLWNRDTGECEKVVDLEGGHVVDVSRCTQSSILVLALSDGRLVLVDLADLAVVYEHEALPQPVLARFSLSADTFVTSSRNREVRFQEMYSQEWRHAAFFSDKVVRWAELNTEAGMLAYDDTYSVHLYDYVRRTAPDPLPGGGKVVFAYRFSPDGSRVAIGSADNIVRLWDAGTGECLGQTPRLRCRPRCLCFVGNNADVAIGGDDGTVQLWSLPAASDPLPVVAEGLPRLSRLEYDAAHVRLTGHVDTGLVIVELDGSTPPRHIAMEKVLSFASSPDGKEVAVSLGTAEIQVLDIETCTVLHTLADYTDRVTRLEYSPDGRFLLSSHSGGTVRVWDVHREGCVDEWGVQTTPVVAASFSPRGDTVVFVWQDGGVSTVPFPHLKALMEQAREEASTHPLSDEARQRYML